MRSASGSSLYAGIGARETPAEVLVSMESIARDLALAGWTLRTGMSPGADQAFYRGARVVSGPVELYLPWPGFEAIVLCGDEGEDVKVLDRPSRAAFELAERFHPSWRPVSDEARALLARDGHQVLGADLESPAQLVVCWTPDGARAGGDPRSGGTGQALRIAASRSIPVLNLAREEDARRVAEICSEPYRAAASRPTDW